MKSGCSEKVSKILCFKLGGDAEFELNVIINKELISLFLWFGRDLVVQKPVALKEIMGIELKAAANNY